MFGTAFHIAPHFALTASHVAEEYAKWENVAVGSMSSDVSLSIALYLLSVRERNTKLEKQVFLNEESFIRCNVKRIIFPLRTDDVALLILEKNDHLKHFPLLDFRPPKVGEELFTIGFPQSIADLEYVEGYGQVASIGVDPTISSGHVSEVFPEAHSEKYRPYPGVDVYFQSRGGMSGSPVFSRATEHIIGLLSSSLSTPDEHGSYQSFVATLAPLLKVKRQCQDDRERSMAEYLGWIGLEPKNTSDYTFDESGKPTYHGPSLDDLSGRL